MDITAAERDFTYICYELGLPIWVEYVNLNIPASILELKWSAWSVPAPDGYSTQYTSVDAFWQGKYPFTVHIKFMLTGDSTWISE